MDAIRVPFPTPIRITPFGQQTRAVLRKVAKTPAAIRLTSHLHPAFMHAMLLLERRVGTLDGTLADAAQEFLLECSTYFREMRSSRQLGRLLSATALLKRNLLQAISCHPHTRQIAVVLSQVQLQFPFGQKQATGILVSFNRCGSRELFDYEHFASCVQTIIPSCRPVSHSFILHASHKSGLVTAYLEFEKENGSACSLPETKLLKQRLAEEIKAHIEPLQPCIFQQRNEEEIYRNTITLCRELTTPQDLPQVIISFESLGEEQLSFTIIAARPIVHAMQPIKQLWEEKYPSLPFFSEKIDQIDGIGTKGPKEVNIFTLSLAQKMFQRKDRSIDLLAARRFVEQCLKAILGDLRDYNGGLILKQHENQLRFFSSLDHQEDKNLAEAFFFSIYPIAMQCTLSPDCLRKWLDLIYQIRLIPPLERSAFSMKTQDQEQCLLVVIHLRHPSGKKCLEDALQSLKLPTHVLAFSCLPLEGTYLFSFAYLSYDLIARQTFLDDLQKTLQTWKQEQITRQHLRINLRCSNPRLDPRLARNDRSNVLFKMLFDGLIRNTPDHLQLALAKSVAVSLDGKVYTFILRNSYWSNGDPVTAHDFEYSWKKALEPSAHSVFVCTFYPIKNARAASTGQLPTEFVGIQALDDTTLRVELEHPTPYFLELVAHWTYFPVNCSVDRSDPDWAYEEGSDYVCNGPFILQSRKQGQPMILLKNPFYWDVSRVHLEQITIHTTQDSKKEKELFFNGELDVLAHPMANSLGIEEVPEDLTVQQIDQTFHCVDFIQFNAKQYPFHHQHLRQAFSQAIDRSSLLRRLNHKKKKVTSSILSSSHPPMQEETLPAYNPQKALQLFEQSLQELNLTRDQFPRLTIFYSFTTHGPLLQLIARDLSELFDISIDCRKLPWNLFFDHLMSGRYQLACMTWSAWFDDPGYTWSYFKYASDRMNFSNWENEEFISLCNQAERTLSSAVRSDFFAQAEKVLLKDAPLLPLHEYTSHFFQRSNLHKVFFANARDIEEDFV